VTIYEPESFERQGKFSALVARLRSLKWPEATPEARQRTWEAVRRELATGDRSEPAEAAREDEAEVGRYEQLDERQLRRHDFLTQGTEPGYTGALGERVATARKGRASAVTR
jgi:hypothetical protein